MFFSRQLPWAVLLTLSVFVPAPAYGQSPISFSAPAPCGRAGVALKPRVDITATDLNVRSGASAKAAKITSVQGGQQFSVVGFAPGDVIDGEERWFLLRLEKGTTGWVSARFAQPAQQLRESPGDLQSTDPNLYAKPGRRKRDGTLFWPYRFFWSSPVSNGGCPGFHDGDEKDFDPELAKEQLRVLGQEYGVDMIVSLACREHMAALTTRMTRHGQTSPEQESLRLWVNDKYYPRNRKTFLRLGQLSKEKHLYIHCRHGSHRAVVATMAALIASNSASSLEDALLRARGHLASFRPGYARPLFRHVVRFALEQGLEVEQKYIDFAGMADDEEVTHAP
jgi:uncharacterized protein YgiM (DUF1202 family)